MKTKLETIVDEFVQSLCKEAYELLKETAGQTVALSSEQKYYCQFEGVKCYTYDKMYIEDEAVMVDYTVGDGFEPVCYDEYSDELSTFEAYEIIDIVRNIQEFNR